MERSRPDLCLCLLQLAAVQRLGGHLGPHLLIQPGFQAAALLPLFFCQPGAIEGSDGEAIGTLGGVVEVGEQARSQGANGSRELVFSVWGEVSFHYACCNQSRIQAWSASVKAGGGGGWV